MSGDLFPDQAEGYPELTEAPLSVRIDPTMPLAARMRPRCLDEYIGQSHILGPGKLLRRAIEADRFTSLVFMVLPG